MVASEEILYARRRLDEIKELDIVDDLRWNEKNELWYILVNIHIRQPLVEAIPENTKWYIVFPNNYPSGSVKVYPAVKGGIEDTFNHQNNNGSMHPSGLWRTGKLCLNNPFADVTNIGKEPDCFEEKLYWNAERTVKWVEVASQGNLVREGDYYEIPDFSVKKIHRVLYNEDSVSMLEWESSEAYYGYVDLICGDNAQYYSCAFSDILGHVCKSTKWGSSVTERKEEISGAWIKLSKEPVVNGWQAPNTFKELAIAFRKQNLNLRDILEKIIPRLRDAKKHVLMIGFPIPVRVGEERSIMHWEALLLPVLSSGKKTVKGFRSNEAGWRTRDFQEIITGERELEWTISENWNSKEMLNRGRFLKNLLQKRILLIGAGTLGASIGENLIRGGVYKLTIMDNDVYSIGNSARHTLTMNSVGKSKAAELAKRYNEINPNLSIKAIDKELSIDTIDVIEEYDVILDCTASDSVLRLLESYETRKMKKYISVSFGYKAEILYFAYEVGKIFDLKRYISEFGAKMHENEKNIMSRDLPWEGTGCWSPVFPAMAADVQMVASFATGIIKTLLEDDVNDGRYYMYEKSVDEEGVITGFARI